MGRKTGILQKDEIRAVDDCQQQMALKLQVNSKQPGVQAPGAACFNAALPESRGELQHGRVELLTSTNHLCLNHHCINNRYCSTEAAQFPPDQVAEAH